MRCCPKVATPSTPLQPYLSAVLGSNEANTLEMASAYGTARDGWTSRRPAAGRDGVRRERRPPAGRRTRARSRSSVPTSRRPQTGSCRTRSSTAPERQPTSGVPRSGRPEPMTNHDNAWFIGSVPQLTAAIWVGLPSGADPDGAAAHADHRVRRDLPGPDLARPDAPGHGRRCLRNPSRPPRCATSSVAVDVTQHPYCLPNAYTLPMDVEVLHFIAGTEPDPDLHHSDRAPEGHRCHRWWDSRRPTRSRHLEQSGFYVQVPDRNEHPASRDDHLSDAVGRCARLPDEHRHDHRWRRRCRPRLSDTHGPSIQKRQGRSVPDADPDARAGAERSPADAAGVPFDPYLAPAPGPPHRGSGRPRTLGRSGPAPDRDPRSGPFAWRTDMRSMPSSGCAALSKTRAPRPLRTGDHIHASGACRR